MTPWAIAVNHSPQKKVNRHSSAVLVELDAMRLLELRQLALLAESQDEPDDAMVEMMAVRNQ